MRRLKGFRRIDEDYFAPTFYIKFNGVQYFLNGEGEFKRKTFFGERTEWRLLERMPLDAIKRLRMRMDRIKDLTYKQVETYKEIKKYEKLIEKRKSQYD